MSITAADVRRAHDQAIASLTPDQAMAVNRLINARMMSSFTAAGEERRLAQACILEAEQLSTAIN